MGRMYTPYRCVYCLLDFWLWIFRLFYWQNLVGIVIKGCPAAKYVNTRLHVDICVLIVLSFSFCNFVFHSLMGIFIVLYCAFFRLFSLNFILFFFDACNFLVFLCLISFLKSYDSNFGICYLFFIHLFGS